MSFTTSTESTSKVELKSFDLRDVPTQISSSTVGSTAEPVGISVVIVGNQLYRVSPFMPDEDVVDLCLALRAQRDADGDSWESVKRELGL
jgi:hypothetical protein